MKSTKQTVYLPTSDSNCKLQVGTIDNSDYYKSFKKETDVTEEEGYFFTPEQLNKYTQSVIKQALETAAEKADTCMEKGIMDEYRVVDKQSITNTFEETFKKFEV